MVIGTFGPFPVPYPGAAIQILNDDGTPATLYDNDDHVTTILTYDVNGDLYFRAAVGTYRIAVERSLGGPSATTRVVVTSERPSGVGGIPQYEPIGLSTTTKAGLASTYQPLDADLGVIAAINTSTPGALATDGAGWFKKTYTQFKTALGLVKADVGLGNVDNTADVDKGISLAAQAALNLKADLASPALTGNPTAPTQAAGNNSTRLATTAFTAAADALRLQPRGAWVTATVYAVNDAVIANGVAWRCILAHTSGASFSSDPTKWERFGVGQVLSTAPSSPATDDLWYDKANELWKRWSGSAWIAEGSSAYATLGELAGLAFYDVVGHSVPAGGGTTNGDWNSYPYKLAFMLGSPQRIRNMAIGGSRSCWQSNRNSSGDGGWGHLFTYGSQSIPPVGTDAGAPTNENLAVGGANRVPALPQSDIAIVQAATNDLGSLGIGNPTPMQEAHRSIIARLTAAALAKVNDTSLTFTGTWSTGGAAGGATAPDNLKTTSTVNDKVTFAVPVISQDAGTRMVGFTVIVVGGYDYTLGVKIDGVSQTDVHIQASTMCDQAGPDGSTSMTNAVTRRYSVDQTVTHSVVITLKTMLTGLFALDSCYIESDPNDGPIILVPGFHRCVDYSLWAGFPHAADYTDANILTWNGYTSTVASEFAHCLFVDYDSAINKDPALIFGDNAHLNDAGHGVLAKTIFDALLASGKVTSRRVSRVSPGLGEFWKPVGQGIFNYPAFQNSWVNATGVGGSTCAFHKDVNGRVYLRGVIRSGTSAGAVIFTLPTGHRPSTNKWFPTVVANAGSAMVQQLQVSPSGDVSYATSGSTGASCLDGVIFDAEQ